MRGRLLSTITACSPSWKEHPALHQPELELGFLAHAVLGPGWRPHQFDARVLHARHGRYRLLHLSRQRAGDRAGGRRQGHLDVDRAVLVDEELVDEAEIDEGDGDLGIAHRLQRLDYFFLERRVACIGLRALDLVLVRRRLAAEIEEVLVLWQRHGPTPSSPWRRSRRS